MSITRNRELSQFGSFIYIENASQDIGITTEATPYVGVGTTNPTVKFHVVGDTNLQGNVTVTNGTLEASSYTLNGNPLVSAQIEYWTLGAGGQDIYRLPGNIGIGTSVISEKLTVRGNVSAGQFISTVTSGTAPFTVLSDTQVTNLNASLLRGKTPPSGDIVGTTDTQTLTNKTLTSPSVTSLNVVSGGIGVTGGVSLRGSTSGLTLLQASSVASGTITIPSATDTLVGRATTDTFTNKTISAGANTISGLTNANLSGSAGITTANLAQYTISGISLGSNLQDLNFGSYLNSTGSYNGSTSRTVSIAATSVNTANTLVARDGSGDFTAGTVNATILNATTSIRINGTTINNGLNLIGLTNANFTGIVTASSLSVVNINSTGIVTATDFNSTSDLSLKENVRPIENAVETLSNLRGVSFNWKSTNQKSLGVIAQEVEEVLPELVSNTDPKTVNYNGLIGILIEAVKELSTEVQELKKQLNN